MSIRLHHGYRVHTRDPEAFLAAAEEVLAPVRDHLDAALYAQLAAQTYDLALLGRRHYTHPTLAEEALDEFRAYVEQGRPGTVFHHPHSLDVDYGYPPGTTGTPLYVLLHVQRDDYHDAFRTLPGVEPYPYWTSTDAPDDVTQDEWGQRRANWAWLIDAPRIADVMTRWTYRPDSSPNLDRITQPDVFAAYLPPPAARARTIAHDVAVAETVSGIEQMRLEDIIRAHGADATRERAAVLAPLIAAQLPPLTQVHLCLAQPEPLNLQITEPETT